jgi:hypothetical protein
MKPGSISRRVFGTASVEYAPATRVFASGKLAK